MLQMMMDVLHMFYNFQGHVLHMFYNFLNDSFISINKACFYTKRRLSSRETQAGRRRNFKVRTVSFCQWKTRLSRNDRTALTTSWHSFIRDFVASIGNDWNTLSEPLAKALDQNSSFIEALLEQLDELFSKHYLLN